MRCPSCEGAMALRAPGVTRRVVCEDCKALLDVTKGAPVFVSSLAEQMLWREPFPIGATTTSNLFPLCRGHHRLKTTGGWRYIPLDHDQIVWISPAGRVHRRHIR